MRGREVRVPTGRATGHVPPPRPLLPGLELWTLAWEAPRPQASQSSSFPDPPRSHLCQQPFRAPGEARALLSGRPQPGPWRSLNPAHGSFWGETRRKKRRARVKLFYPRRAVCGGVLGGTGRLGSNHTHVRPNSLPSSIAMATEHSHTKEIGK